VAAGVRRIEAITGQAAEDFFNEQTSQFKQVRELLKNPKDTVKAIEGLVAEKAALEKQLESLRREKMKSIVNDLIVSPEAFITFNIEEESLNKFYKELSSMIVNAKPNTTALVAANTTSDIVSISGATSGDVNLKEKFEVIKGQLGSLKGGGSPKLWTGTVSKDELPKIKALLESN
jgi:alanyl-tRNA synthetase